MQNIKLLPLDELPENGEGKFVLLMHPFTEVKYELAVFQVKGKIYVLPEACRTCNSSLSKGVLSGMYAYCTGDDHGWNIKNGICKFNRLEVTPTYKAIRQEDGLYIEMHEIFDDSVEWQPEN